MNESTAIECLRKQFPWPERRPDARPVPWSLDGGGRELVVDLIRRDDVKVLLEIGSFLGGSTRVWLDASPELVVIAVDPWKGDWGEFARRNGYDDCVEQLSRVDGGYETFLTNLWDHRERIIPVRGLAPAILHEVHAAGVSPDLIYIDSDKSGRELSTCQRLFPASLLTGDDWTWGADEGYPMRPPVMRVAEESGLFLRTKMATWVLDDRRPPLSYRVRQLVRRIRRRAA